jgi:hypothetical protein
VNVHVLWEEDGMPEGRADEYWHRALDQHLRDRAYVLWEQAGLVIQINATRGADTISSQWSASAAHLRANPVRRVPQLACGGRLVQ